MFPGSGFTPYHYPPPPLPLASRSIIYRVTPGVAINRCSVSHDLTVRHDPALASSTSSSPSTRYLPALSPLVRHGDHNPSLHYFHNTRYSILKSLIKEVPPSSMLIFISLTKSRTPQKISEDHYLDQEPLSASVSWWKQTLRLLPVTDSGH